ncbi:MAG: hypothetical protein IK096_00680 [Lachnospiraceae bacterium]|nr:hypothetical protein [Lachnospiraceae bacterium]
MDGDFLWLMGVIFMLLVGGFLFKTLGHALMNIGKGIGIVLLVIFILAGANAMGIFG